MITLETLTALALLFSHYYSYVTTLARQYHLNMPAYPIIFLHPTKCLYVRIFQYNIAQYFCAATKYVATCC